MPGRYAIFVDAAYLWASVGELLFGTNDRSRLSCDYEGLVGSLVDATAADAGRELLRTYWYDGAVNKVPTPEQKRVGQLPSVKLRLGRIVGGHQKGVDSLIVLDLLKLSTTGMVDTIYLFSGDDDLTEGVREAQALGVRVVLIGASTVLPRQSEAILLEADGVHLWGESLWRPHFSLASSDAEPAHQHDRGGDAVHTFERVGYAFSMRWLDEASDEDVARVHRSRPRIPSDIDSRLLWDTSAGRDLSEGERVALRDGFWRAVDEDAAEEAAEAAEELAATLDHDGPDTDDAVDDAPGDNPDGDDDPDEGPDGSDDPNDDPDDDPDDDAVGDATADRARA